MPILWATIQGEHFFEVRMHWGEFLFLCIAAAIAMTIFTVLCSPLGVFASSLMSAARRNKLPVQYRQRPRNWIPLKSVVWAAIFCMSLGATYGKLTDSWGLPRFTQPGHDGFGAFTSATPDAGYGMRGQMQQAAPDRMMIGKGQH